MLHDRTLLNCGSPWSRYKGLFVNRAVLCTLSKIGKPGMALKDKQLMAVQHVHNGKDMYGYQRVCQFHFYAICIRASHPLWKGRSVYCHHGLGKPQFCMVQLHITFVYFPKYFSVLLPVVQTYLYGECNETAYTCVNKIPDTPL